MRAHWFRWIPLVLVLIAFVAPAALPGQETPDSAALAGRDSLAAEIARELGADSLAPAAPPPPAAAVPGGTSLVVQGAAPSFNPDISVIGDFLADLSPDRSTLEGGDRFVMREVELGLQAVVDPYFRADFFLALKEGEIELEEGYLTTLALPSRFQAKLGKFHLPYGKVNLTHRPELRTIEYPRVVQLFFGDDGFASTGLWVSKILSPFGFYQELIGVLGNDLGAGIREGAEQGSEGGDASENGGDSDLFDDLGDRLLLGHLKNYVDFSEAANLEVGFSIASGEDRPGEALSERLTFYGVDAIYRWRPPAAGRYKSLVLQAEATWRDAEDASDFGAFAFGQVQVGRRWLLGARYDLVEHLDTEPAEWEHSISGYVTLLPSEFSLFRLGYEHRALEVDDDLDRILAQATFTLGPHRPHPF